MHKRPGNHRWLRQEAGLDGRIEKMLAAGRMTADEAGRLRAAGTPDEREEVARSIQARHARGRIDEAVANGRLTAAEGAEYFNRLNSGEDLRFLRGLRSRRGGAE